MSAIGIDTGGTFTDFVWYDADGRFRVAKRLSTPHDPGEAILAGLAATDLPDGAGVIHGSTVATNALLERRGARTAVITTAGFADVLEIGRQNRPDIYALVPQKPEPLVPASWRFEVEERVDSQGQAQVALQPEAFHAIIERLRAERIESVAVCLLFSFLNPTHEHAIRQALLAARSPDDPWNISLSVEILPEYREFERTAATVINAYVTPLMSSYLNGLATGVAPRTLTMMQSNGGVISAGVAGVQAARTVLSGPAGGVVGAMHVAAAAGLAKNNMAASIITFDMGGTSTDVALCPGRLPMTTESEIGGLPLRLPMIDIHTVGAGGGSLAHIDAGGALHVGPQSAGAKPGPACYRADYAGWRRRLDAHFSPGYATVSDANLVLGRLVEDHFLGGTMRLSREAAANALEHLAAAMKAESATAAAWGVVRVANANMVRAIRRISVERGFDPRRFALVAFGGGGPLHACEMAEQLQMDHVLIPPTPGVLSALGMLVAVPARDYSQTVMRPLPKGAAGGIDDLVAVVDRLQETAEADMVVEGHRTTDIQAITQLDARYTGQSFEMTIPFMRTESTAAIRQRFDAAHRWRYGYDRPEASVEVVTVRLTAKAPSAVSVAAVHAAEQSGERPNPVLQRRVWLGTETADIPVYQRADLQPGATFNGPALVVQYDTTTLLQAGWSAVVDRAHNLHLRRAPIEAPG